MRARRAALCAGLLACACRESESRSPGATLPELAQPAAPAPSSPSAGPELVALGSNESFLYPRREEVAIERVAPLAAGVGLELLLTSDLGGFSHFEVEIDGMPARETAASIDVRFKDDHRPEIETVALRIVAVAEGLERSRERALEVSYFPAELYAANGRTSPGSIVIGGSDIPIVGSRVGDWVVDRPPAEDVAFARAVWGGIVDREPTTRGKARALAIAIVDDLDSKRGVPSDEMSEAPPFEQYRRARAGLDHVWCDNFAEIFVRALVSFGISARIIELPGRKIESGGAEIFLSDGHTTTELFDEVENRWIWLDLTLNVLGAELEGFGPAHLADLHRALNDPHGLERLKVTSYDPSTRQVSEIPAVSDGVRESLLTFFHVEQPFLYARSTEAHP